MEAIVVYFKLHVPGETRYCVTDLKKGVPRSKGDPQNSCYT
jgi:hypothetical protein